MLQQEVSDALDGRIVKSWRRGEYADVSTPDFLVECKMLSEGRVAAAWIEKTKKLAHRLRKRPVIVVGVDDVRAVFFLNDDRAAIEQFRPCLDAWYRKGLSVWVAGLSRAFFTEAPQPIPKFRGYLGVQYGLQGEEGKAAE